jgi:hypothetical protein
VEYLYLATNSPRLPHFLIMKDEGEVWQLATGEASVCWKCGKSGHIGDKCRQNVNVLAESIASPAVGNQPSWAHVVKGGVSVVPPPPLLPPPVAANPHLYRNPYKCTSDILIAAKAALKAVPVKTAPAGAAAVDQGDQCALKEDQVGGKEEHSYALANPPSPAMELSVDNSVNDSMQGNCSSDTTQFSKPKKGKLSDDFAIVDNDLSSSPVLHHKLTTRPMENQDSQSQDSEYSQVRGVKTNMCGVKFVMWFHVGIEGKDPMGQDEDDWGGKIEFGFSDKNFPKEVEDYFLLFEDKCDQAHACAGRVMSVASHVRDKVLEPPRYDPRNIVELIDKYGDAHINDTGWREVDTEEWFGDC